MHPISLLAFRLSLKKYSFMKMKELLIFCLLVFSGFCAKSQTGSYSLFFSDDFEGNSLDLTRWNKETGYAPNQELQYYTDRTENVRVEDGNLVLTARKEQYVSNRNYTSGKVTTKGKGFVRYGKIEARISVPSGAGTWPAFWMMSENNEYGTWPNSGEIDIMEHIGSDPTMISHAVHTANKNGSRGNNWYRRVYRDNVENNFHVYTLVWGPDEMKFIVDDVESTTLYRNFAEDYHGWPFDINFYAILNLAMGGTMGGAIDDNIFNGAVEMKIDYVRMYQLTTALDAPENSSLEVFPSGFTDCLNIRSEIPVKVNIYNVAGKKVLEKEISGNELIDTRNFPAGMYVVRSPYESMKVIKL